MAELCRVPPDGHASCHARVVLCRLYRPVNPGGMLDILNQDFIRTARAKGVRDHEIILKHALRGGLLPVVAFLGPAFAGLLSGSFVVEKVFNVPGIGQEFIKSVFNRDYPLVLGTVAFFGVLIVVFNLASDILQALMDPKTRK